MGFFKDFKRDFAQAINELMPENDELANEYDDEDMVNTFDEDNIDIAPEDLLEDIDETNDEADDNENEEHDTLSMLEDMENDQTMYEINNSDTEEKKEIPEAELISDNEFNTLEELGMVGTELEDVVVDMGDEEVSDKILSVDRQEEGLDKELDKELDEEAMLIGEETDELKATDELDEENMIENLEDALAVEAETQESTQEDDMRNVDFEKAVSDAVLKEEIEAKQEEQPKEYEDVEEEEKDMSDVTAVSQENEVDGMMTDDTTYITKNTKIKGDIETEGGVDLIGTVEGNLTCIGKLIVGGTIKGNVNAGEVYANGAKIEGEITSDGSVKIGVGSVVVGNVVATSAVVAGAVNGDIDVKGPVIVDSTAVIMGNIKSRSVQINNGAVIEGFCSQCYSEIDVKSFFE